MKFSYPLIIVFLSLNVPDSKVKCANDKFDDVFKGAQNVKCNKKTEQKIDKLLPILLPAGTDQPIPETQKQLKEYCNLIDRSMPFILGVFKHCSNPFAKTIAKFTFYPIRKQMSSICRPGKLSRNARALLKMGKCGNLAREPIRQCNNQFTDAIIGISSAPVKDRMNMVCCHVNEFRDCLIDNTEDTVGCSRQTIELADGMAMKMAGSSLSTFCGEYFQSSDKCKNLLRDTPKPNYSEQNKRPTTIVIPLIKLMESLPDLDSE